MKALSIIGIVCSLIGFIISINIADIGCFEGDYLYRPGKGLAFLSFIINLFFLAFSITSTVVSFRKKNVTA